MQLRASHPPSVSVQGATRLPCLFKASYVQKGLMWLSCSAPLFLGFSPKGLMWLSCSAPLFPGFKPQGLMWLSCSAPLFPSFLQKRADVAELLCPAFSRLFTKRGDVAELCAQLTAETKRDLQASACAGAQAARSAWHQSKFVL